MAITSLQKWELALLFPFDRNCKFSVANVIFSPCLVVGTKITGAALFIGAQVNTFLPVHLNQLELRGVSLQKRERH